MLLHVTVESLFDRLHCELRGQGTVQELAHRRASDDFRSGKAGHLTKAIAAVDDVTAAGLSVRDKKASI